MASSATGNNSRITTGKVNGSRADGERDHGDDGKIKVLAQHARTETQVLRQSFDHRPSLLLAGSAIEVWKRAAVSIAMKPQPRNSCNRFFHHCCLPVLE